MNSPSNARPRVFLTVVRLYVTGGNDPHSLVQVYCPVTQIWTLGTPLPTPRIQAACVVAGSLIYVFGGIIYDGTLDCETTAFVFDTTTSMW